MNKIIRIFTKESAVIPVIAIIFGLLVGAIVMLVGGYNPLLAYKSLLIKVFGSSYDIGETLREITPLILAGLAVAFTFRTGLFNIGGAGQMVIGSLGSLIVGIKFQLPWFIHAPLAILVGALLAGLYGAIAGFLKAKRGINEVITTIMLNWIALFFVNYVIRVFLADPKNRQRSYYIEDTSAISSDFLSGVFDHARVNWGFVLAILAAIVFYIILQKTKIGYELRSVGFNPHASEYAGMNIGRNIILAMFIGGLFAGLAGVTQTLGVYKYTSISAALPSYGFNGIAVALLGGNTALGVVLGATLFGMLSYGAAGMKMGAGVPPEVVNVVIASVIFFVAAHGTIRWIIAPLYAKRKEKEVQR